MKAVVGGHGDNHNLYEKMEKNSQYKQKILIIEKIILIIRRILLIYLRSIISSFLIIHSSLLLLYLASFFVIVLVFDILLCCCCCCLRSSFILSFLYNVHNPRLEWLRNLFLDFWPNFEVWVSLESY